MGESGLQDQEIYGWVATQLTEMFEISAARIKPDAQLFQDLDIDSIDAVDLMVKLNQYVGRRVPPEAFKSVRTVQDVVNIVRVLKGG